MKPLDDVTRRCFPTLAECERQMHRRIVLATLLSILDVYVLGRDLLSAYQGRVATQNMTAMVGRVNALEEKCQQEYPKRLTMTKVQVWNAAREKEKEKSHEDLLWPNRLGMENVRNRRQQSDVVFRVQ